MRKLIAVAGIAAAVGFIVVPAQAEPVACVEIHLDVNGTPVDQSVCLPPEA